MSRRSPKIRFNEPLGWSLRRQRLALDLSLQECARLTKIRISYLKLLEVGDYTKLPHTVYSLGFVKKYAKQLKLSPAVAAKKYLLERGPLTPPQQQLKPLKQQRPIVTSRLLTVVAGILLLLILTAYVIWQVVTLTLPPRLTLSQPPTDLLVHETTLVVEGHTQPGSLVFIGGQGVVVDDKGHFRGEISLHKGLNTIEVVAQNQRGKSTTITRHVVYEPR